MSNVRAVTAVENLRERLIGVALKFRAVPSCYSSHLIPDAVRDISEDRRMLHIRASKDKEHD